MSESKHTPGPWAIDQGTIISDESRFIAGMEMPFSGLVGEDAANARLIAAAPDLLAVCEEAANLGVTVWHCNYNCGECVRCLARAAIAKATESQTERAQ